MTALAGKRIILTGATGVVGSALLRSLSASGCKLLVLSRSPDRVPKLENVQAGACDLENLGTETSAAITRFAPDAFIHAGWAGTENSERNDPKFVAMNLNASMRLLEAAEKSGCKHWISFGSQAEYSDNLSENIAEHSPTWPLSAYGMTKLALCHSEQALCEKAGMTFTWLRLFTCYGREYKPSYVIAYLIDRLRSGTMPELRTPHAVWDCLHADDAARAVQTILTHPDPSGIFNLASGKGVSVGEMAVTLAELLNYCETEKLRDSIAADTAPASRRVADIAHIAAHFGWKPDIDLRAGLAKCL